MAIRGPEPRSRHSTRRLTHEFIDVLNEPFAGRPPVSLPRKRIIRMGAAEIEADVLPMTRDWWNTIRKMPHCILWAESDWLFAQTTALVADLAFRGVSSAATELRVRERIMGVTVDDRRALRIRYVERIEDEPPPPPAKVVNLDRRQRINRG